MNAPTFLVKPSLIARLAADFESLQNRGSPTAEDLSSAPLLTNWSVGRPCAFGLKGQVIGHPLIQDGEVWTSAAYVLAGDRSWVRTLSRYYRLAV